ncbi:MAG: hypothetical protein ACRDHK_10955, partial [Actinomycetota bacterium]
MSVYTPFGQAVSSGDFYIPPAPYGASDVEFTARMSTGGIQTATINTSGKIGLVLFDGAEGQRVSLKITGVTVGSSVCCSMKVWIVGPAGTNVVPPTWVGTTGGFIDTVTLPTAGTYTIVTDPEDTATGSATLTLYDVPADPAPGMTPGGPAATVSISTPGQNARPAFTGSAGQRVSLKLTGVTVANSFSTGPQNACCSLKVSILKPDGSTLVGPATLGTVGGFIDTVTLPTAGMYTILVDPVSDGTGSATLTLYDVPADPAPGMTPGGPAATVSISTPGQNARLTFT